MPETIEDLGKKVKAKYPGQYDDMSDVDLGKKIKAKYPDAYKDFTDAAFQKPKGSVRETAQAHQKSMESGEAKAQYEKAIKSADEDIATRRGQVGKDVLMMGAAAAAAPITAGASVPLALAIMGGAGVVGGLAGEGYKALVKSPETAKSLGDLSVTLGFDGATMMAGEGIGRVGGAVLKGLLPKLMARSAAQVARGSDALNEMAYRADKELFGKISEFASAGAAANVSESAGTALAQSARRAPVRGLLSGKATAGPVEAISGGDGTYYVNASKPIKRLLEEFGELPPPTGPMTKRFGGLTAKAQEGLNSIKGELNLSQGTIGVMQRLDSLIRSKRSIQAFAYEAEGLSRDEKVIFKRFAKDLDSLVKDELKTVGEDASALYKHGNDISKAQLNARGSIALAEHVLRTMTNRAVSGAVGGGIGYYYGGNPMAGVMGAAAGAAMPNLSALALEQTLAHPKAAPLMKKAVNIWLEGSQGEAKALATRALGMAGVRQWAKEATSEQP